MTPLCKRVDPGELHGWIRHWAVIIVSAGPPGDLPPYHHHYNYHFIRDVFAAGSVAEGRPCAARASERQTYATVSGDNLNLVPELCGAEDQPNDNMS